MNVGRRVSIPLTASARAAAESVASKRGFTRTDVIDRGLALQRYLEDIDSQGGKIIIEHHSGFRERISLDW